MKANRVMLRVETTDPELLAKAAEHLARVMTGMALEGADCWMSAGPDDSEED